MISDDLIWAQDYLLVTSNDQIVPDCKPGIDKGYMIKSTATRTGVQMKIAVPVMAVYAGIEHLSLF
jgi:hypothetical protein